MTDASQPSPRSSNFSRREFIELTWRGVLWVCGMLGSYIVLRFLSHLSSIEKPSRLDLGLLSEIPTDGPIVLSNASAMLIPGENGIKAFSLECTHLGCQVEFKKTKLICPCHGSEFALDGTVLKGPADRALQPLELDTSNDGHLILIKDV